MKKQAIVGIVLIVVGVAGLLFVGSAWRAHGGAPWWGPQGPWSGGPMMRGFGRHHMFGPGWGPGGGPGRRWGGAQVLPPVAGARTIDIVATESTCQPAEVSIKTGEAVNIRLVNQGVTPHSLVLPQQRIWLFAPPGQSVTSGVKTDQPGEYTFFCGAPGNRQAQTTTGRIVVTP